MSKPVKQKYKTTNWASYTKALRARGSLTIWLDRDMAWQAPDYSTLSRRKQHLTVEIAARSSQGGLHLLVDSTGIKVLGEGEWKISKHGAQYRRQWRKVHLGIDAQTLEIRAIEVTDNSVGDAQRLPELLGQIPTQEVVLSVSGDRAYDTQHCHEAIAQRGAEAVIPTRKNARLWRAKRGGSAARNEILRATRRLGRGIWKKWSGYHRRSLVETKMRCFKLLGERVSARTFERQVVELQVRAAVLNRLLHPSGHAGDAGCGITPSGVRGGSALAGLCNKARLNCSCRNSVMT